MADQRINRALMAELQACSQLLQQGRVDDAESRMRALAHQHPFHPAVQFTLGHACWEAGRHQEAVQAWRRTLSADPEHLPAMTYMTKAMLLAGDLREALRYTQMAVRRRPQDPGLLGNLGIILGKLGRNEEAIATMREVLRLSPGWVALRSQLMDLLDTLERDEEAFVEAQAILNQPDQGYHAAALATAFRYASKRSRWDLTDRFGPQLSAAVRRPNRSGVPPLTLTWLEDEPAVLRTLGEAEVLPSSRTASRTGVWSGGRMTIAYITPDLRDHPVAHMLLPVLAAHDRKRVRIVLVATRTPDASAVAQAVLAQADAFLDLSGKDDGDACLAIRAMGVDVLVDLCGGTRGNHPTIFARGAAQAQLLWLGCPATTGTPYYDAFLVDSTIAPPDYERHCSEPLLRLPCCYHPISAGLHSRNSAIRRGDLGLPDDAIIVGMLQQPRKILPPFIDRIAAAIGSLPGCHLALRAHADAHEAVAARLSALGLPRERIHLFSRFPTRDDYLAIYPLLDLAVDSFPYGGHSTTGEALILGTPVLTSLGRSIHSRVAASMLHELDLDELVAPDIDAMLTLLARLVGEPASLAELRRRCQAAAERYRPDGIRRLAGALEDAYAEVLGRLTAAAAGS